MSVLRIYTEKKPGFNIEATALLRELRHIFGISGLTNLRIINRYDTQGLDEAYIKQAVNTVFSEPQLDSTYDELPGGYDYAFAAALLPGQFDQRADSCAQCLQMLTCGERPLVNSARVYLLYGTLSDDDIRTIKTHLINPIESTEVSFDMPETLCAEYEPPEPVRVLDGFSRLQDSELPDFLEQHGFAMDSDDLAFCRDYFQKEGRDPTYTELRVIDTYWSDHCRHTTFLTNLDDIRIEDEFVKSSFDIFLQHKSAHGRAQQPVTLMEIATAGARVLEHMGKLDSLDKSEEINACSVKIKVNENGTLQDWLLMFKNETHNHPTEIEPFGGASTCIGGAIRDVLAGRGYVYQAMRITGSGDPSAPVSGTLPGKLPQRSITTKAARGFSSYGNQIGVATGLVREIYHPGYIAKRLETGAIIGAARAGYVMRQAPVPGDAVILLGGRTGRDGCGGATGSSKAHDTHSLMQCGAEVQKGNAPEERKIQRLLRSSEVTQMIKRCNDFGAGGVAVAVGELSDGLDINLDAILKKYSSLDGTELAISESQERMAVVVSAGNAASFITLAGRENLEATVIAVVTDTGRMMMRQQGRKIVDISREFLNSNGTVKYAKAAVNKMPPVTGVPFEDAPADKQAAGSGRKTADCCFYERLFAALAADLNICSQKGLIDCFDSTIGAGTVIMPLGGIYQMTPSQAMAAKIPVPDAVTDTCSVMSFAFYPDCSQQNPYAAAYLAVAASAAKVIAAGGSLSQCWLSFQEYFEKPGDSPERWGKPFSALLGAFQAQIDLGIASIGGKDSMSGSFKDLDVPPTLISFAVSVTDGDNIISGEFKKAGSSVVLMPLQYRDDGVPCGQHTTGIYKQVEELIHDGKVLSAYVVETGSICEAIFKMALGNRIGFEFSQGSGHSSRFPDELLTGHFIGSIILELNEPVDAGIPLGKTAREYAITINGEIIDCMMLQEEFEKPLETVFPAYIETTDEPVPVFDFDIFAGADAVSGQQPDSRGQPGLDEQPDAAHPGRLVRSANVRMQKPRVLIPVFPGTNCEYDMARAFEAAGAAAEMPVIRNLTPADMEDSVKALSDAIFRSQIIALPGGFSGGDEPDGSGKFIVSFFKNPRIKDAVHDLLKRRDGLMCGICNGFQALIKLGLVPYGEITDTDEHCPSLTYNLIGRHQSMLVRTRIASNLSPWLADCKPGDIHTIPVSHGEGRFIASIDFIEQLAASGQIAAQYADLNDIPTMDIRFNPNGSVCAIEAITSPDGRVLGKMGHNERCAEGLYKNVQFGDSPRIAQIARSGAYNIFSAAVRYYAL